MSHMTNTPARVEIVTVTADGDLTVHCTQHWHGTYINARSYVARYIADNGLHRVTYGDGASLLRGGTVIGYYTITRA